MVEKKNRDRSCKKASGIARMSTARAVIDLKLA